MKLGDKIITMIRAKLAPIIFISMATKIFTEEVKKRFARGALVMKRISCYMSIEFERPGGGGLGHSTKFIKGRL